MQVIKRWMELEKTEKKTQRTDCGVKKHVPESVTLNMNCHAYQHKLEFKSLRSCGSVGEKHDILYMYILYIYIHVCILYMP